MNKAVEKVIVRLLYCAAFRDASPLATARSPVPLPALRRGGGEGRGAVHRSRPARASAHHPAALPGLRRRLPPGPDAARLRDRHGRACSTTTSSRGPGSTSSWRRSCACRPGRSGAAWRSAAASASRSTSAATPSAGRCSGSIPRRSPRRGPRRWSLPIRRCYFSADLDLGPELFDLAICSEVLEHIAEPHAAARRDPRPPVPGRAPRPVDARTSRWSGRRRSGGRSAAPQPGVPPGALRPRRSRPRPRGAPVLPPSASRSRRRRCAPSRPAPRRRSTGLRPADPASERALLRGYFAARAASAPPASALACGFAYRHFKECVNAGSYEEAAASRRGLARVYRERFGLDLEPRLWRALTGSGASVPFNLTGALFFSGILELNGLRPSGPGRRLFRGGRGGRRRSAGRPEPVRALRRRDGGPRFPEPQAPADGARGHGAGAGGARDRGPGAGPPGDPPGRSSPRPERRPSSGWSTPAPTQRPSAWLQGSPGRSKAGRDQIPPRPRPPVLPRACWRSTGRVPARPRICSRRVQQLAGERRRTSSGRRVSHEEPGAAAEVARPGARRPPLCRDAGCSRPPAAGSIAERFVAPGPRPVRRGPAAGRDRPPTGGAAALSSSSPPETPRLPRRDRWSARASRRTSRCAWTSRRSTAPAGASFLLGVLDLSGEAAPVARRSPGDPRRGRRPASDRARLPGRRAERRGAVGTDPAADLLTRRARHRGVPLSRAHRAAPAIRTAYWLDAFWCDSHGLYLRGWVHAHEHRVRALRVESAGRSARVETFTDRPDLLAFYPEHEHVRHAGFAVYLACPPGHPVSLTAGDRRRPGELPAPSAGRPPAALAVGGRGDGRPISRRC